MDTAAIDDYLRRCHPRGRPITTSEHLGRGRCAQRTFRYRKHGRFGRKPTARNVVFLTDGQTESYDIAYGAYGIDALDRRRWTPGGLKTLDQVVEDRFLVACRQIRAMNANVFVIAFGTELNPVMKECAGEGRYFEATDAAQLDKAFSKIADSLGDLRITY